MKEIKYQKYKISIGEDSKKSQGLKIGDVVLRQYIDGADTIVTYMCVLETGDKYFIGALLWGDVPKSGELLDFVRITNLFDEDRMGALYLTASDSNAPYLDVIDNISKNKSLCYPTGICLSSESLLPQNQLVVSGAAMPSVYERNLDEYNRYCKIVRREGENAAAQFGLNAPTKRGEKIVIAYSIRGVDDARLSCRIGNASAEIDITSNWMFVFQVFESQEISSSQLIYEVLLNELDANDEIEIANFNAINLSSLLAFNMASNVRVGKLDGVVDKQIGELKGYGAYTQNLYATQNAHVSGTLTAGDENGFGSTFYAGKIRKNEAINSLSPNITEGAFEIYSAQSPTGIGNCLLIKDNSIKIRLQEDGWSGGKGGELYTLSFWVKELASSDLTIRLSNSLIKTWKSEENGEWRRRAYTFRVYDSFNGVLSVETSTPSSVLISSLQLEKGENASQYQATDEELSESGEYGAWFCRGGIGGTIQNPLLRLNYEGKGGIGTKSQSFLLRQDGSGFLANKNISWNSDGKLSFGKDVTLNWENFDEETQQKLGSTLSVDILSSNGNIFKDGECSTILKAVVKENGGILSSEEVSSRFYFQWYKLKLNGGEREILSGNSQSIEFSSKIEETEVISCEVLTI